MIIIKVHELNVAASYVRERWCALRDVHRCFLKSSSTANFACFLALIAENLIAAMHAIVAACLLPQIR